jgi:hydroxylaminobenzene mutase
MDVQDSPAREGQRLLRAGVLLFLLALLVGLGVPRFTVPRLALSTHLLGVMQGTFLLVSGLVWPRLNLTRTLSRAGSYVAVYGCVAAWTANLLGAFWGAGNSMLPIAAGQARGSGVQERIIALALVTAAVSLISVAILMLWGLRASPVERRADHAR